MAANMREQNIALIDRTAEPVLGRAGQRLRVD